MFSKFREKDTTCVELKDITDSRIMSQIIHYMYFNAVSLSPATVQDILSIANYLQIDSLTTACVQFIRERYKFRLLKLVLSVYAIMRMCNAMFIIKADIHVCHKFVMDISTNLKCINQIEWHSMMKKICLGKLRIL